MASTGIGGWVKGGQTGPKCSGTSSHTIQPPTASRPAALGQGLWSAVFTQPAGPHKSASSSRRDASSSAGGVPSAGRVEYSGYSAWWGWGVRGGPAGGL